jgi:hypothetical protein
LGKGGCYEKDMITPYWSLPDISNGLGLIKRKEEEEEEEKGKKTSRFHCWNLPFRICKHHMDIKGNFISMFLILYI